MEQAARNMKKQKAAVATWYGLYDAISGTNITTHYLYKDTTLY